MIRRAAGALLASIVGGLALASAGAAPASAHEVDASILTVVDDVTPAVDGVTIEVGTSVTTQLVAANATDEVLEVLAETGEPFLRIGPAGVEANLASPSWYLTNQPLGTNLPPEDADPTAPPRWARVSAERSWGWFDHRLHPADLVVGLGEGERPTFTVPMRLGGRALLVRGHLEPRVGAPVFAAALRAVPDPATGLLVQLLQGRAPGLFVRWSGSGTVVVEGADGEPFLRLSPAGAEVNRRSPTWLFTAQAEGKDLAGTEIDPRAEPMWVLATEQPSFAWLDPRALIDEVGAAPERRRWTVPVLIDERPHEVVGESTAEVVTLAEVAGAPADDDSRPGWLVPAVAVAAGATVAAAAWLALARRRPAAP